MGNVDVDQGDASPASKPPRCSASSRVFGLTYVGYALLYFVRKPFGVVKHDIALRYNLPTRSLAEVDMAFLLSYTISNLFVGYVEGFFGLYYALVVALLGAALACAAFPCTDIPAMWMLCWAMQGMFQAWVYPLCTKLVTKQFSEQVRNSVWGIWVTCQHVGGMLGTTIAAEISKPWGWRFAFFVPSVWVLASAISMRLLPEEVTSTSGAQQTRTVSDKATGSPSLLAAIRLSSIKELGFSYYCIKLVRYVGVLWLPFFLNDIGFDSEKAAILSIPFDVGGVIGGTFCGVLADRLFGGRLLVVIIAMCLGAGLFCALYAQLHSTLGTLGHSVILLCLGIMIAGPDANFGGAACMSAVVRSEGEDSPLASAASGFINSMGALGTVFTPVLVTAVRANGKPGEGWGGLWLILAVLCFLPVGALLPAALAEHRHLRLRSGSVMAGCSDDDGKTPPQLVGASKKRHSDAEESAVLAIESDTFVIPDASGMQSPSDTDACLQNTRDVV